MGRPELRRNNRSLMTRHPIRMRPPRGIGSHEGRELALMLAGRKPLAMFSDVVPPSFELPEQQFRPYVSAGRLIMRDEIYRNRRPRRQGVALRFLYYAQPHEAWRLHAIRLINRAIFSGAREFRDRDDVSVGRLLGYSSEEIYRFIKFSAQRPARSVRKSSRSRSHDTA